MTARFLGHPALGIPGAKNAKVITIDLLESVGTVYIWEESDKGGKEFVKGVTQHVKNLGYQGTIRVVKHEKAKDLSQLQQWNPELTKHRLSDLLKTAAEVHEDEIKEPTRDGAAKTLVELVEDDCELVHDNRQVCFARVPVGTHLELYSVKSMMFRRWLQYRFYQVEGRPPPREAMASALLQIEALAQFEGEQRDVHLRIAPDREDGIYIDLGDDHWRCIHVSPSMWAVEAHDRIFFRRSAGM
jgi:hypothetical protein